MKTFTTVLAGSPYDHSHGTEWGADLQTAGVDGQKGR